MFKPPDVIAEALRRGARLSISVSGGKDSQAMLRVLGETTEGIEHCEVVHADLGRAEWPQTPGHVEFLAHEAKLPLSVVRRVKGDLVKRIEERLNTVSTVDPTRPAKPFWLSAQQRYCTSDLKRGPIHKRQRSHGRNELIVSCMGMRAEESRASAKKPVVSVSRWCRSCVQPWIFFRKHTSRKRMFKCVFPASSEITPADLNALLLGRAKLPRQ